MQHTKIKWTKDGLDAYREVGEWMECEGYRAAKNVEDTYNPENASLLTFWSRGPEVVISQVFVNGGVCYYQPGKPSQNTGARACASKVIHA